jgi:2-dehydropantoate 2-reductase
MASVAVVGVGAIGAAMAAAVQSAGGHELVLCARRPVERVVVDLPDESSVELTAPLLTDAAASRDRPTG